MPRWSTGHYRKRDGAVIKYKSSWEALYMDLLDSSPQIILRWQYEPFFVIYHDGKKIKKYIPDFFIETQDGRSIIVEIKPERLRENKLNSMKRERMVQKCKEESWEYYEWSPGCNVVP